MRKKQDERASGKESAGKGRRDVPYENPEDEPGKKLSKGASHSPVISVDLHYARVRILNNILFRWFLSFSPRRSLALAHLYIYITQSY